jgi:2-oxo-4-hydroxy-4-carboxy-5-ureidoimidazoline decarboxylase
MPHQNLTLSAVNAMSQGDFVQTFGATFEHSPWVAEGAWKARPFASVDALHAAMMNVVRNQPRERQVAFLCAHPELAGKEAQAGTMTDDSVVEQASAGLNALTRAEMEEMVRLNAEYRAKHGFPFCIAVRRNTKDQIFDAMRRRVANDSETELEENLAQIGYITRLRLDNHFA